MDCTAGELLEISKGLHASEEFDTGGLMEWHARSYRWVEYVESHFPNIVRTSSINEHFGSVVPLRGLQPIRAKSLEIGKHHQGRVLFGTLCADAHRMVSITTVLQDECGDGVRLAIYNAPLSIWRAVDVRRLYPKGAKVAVKEPHFKRADDGLLMVCVDNPQNIEILSLSERDAESALVADLLELRAEGNKCFRDRDWERAIESYSICIDLALFRQKIGPQLTSSLNIEKEVRDAIVCSYSNRAEARLMSKEYGQAVKDCDEASKLDPQHVKTLFRKGRAFHALGEYELASHCFQTALQQCPTAKEIKLEYEKSKKLNEQNQKGKFDLSAYFLNGCRLEDDFEISNYIGPILIKEAVRGGRGLFATENVEIGDVLLVDNAIASTCKEAISISLLTHLDDMSDNVKEDLVAKIISSSVSSPRILQQLQYLAVSSSSDVMAVPPMDLFRINNAKWESYVWRRREGLEVEEDKLPKIMENLTCVTQTNLGRQVKRYGLWALPSFINHSCFPNSNAIVVGEAMVIIATRRIAAGDEITISYFFSLMPLVEREMYCSSKGIRCDCKRCLLERRLAQSQASPFEKIARSVQCNVNESNFPSLPVMKMLLKYAVELEDAMDAYVLSAEEKQLLRASFHSAYYNILVLPGGHSLSARRRLPSTIELVEAGQNACPGNVLSFGLIAMSVAKYQGENSGLFKKAKEVCLTLCGNQDERVLNAVLKSAAKGNFKPSLVDFRFRKML